MPGYTLSGPSISGSIRQYSFDLLGYLSTKLLQGTAFTEHQYAPMVRDRKELSRQALQIRIDQALTGGTNGFCRRPQRLPFDQSDLVNG